MKKSIKLLLGIMFLSASIINAQEQNVNTQDQSVTKSVKVWGNCGMCKKNIEKAANSVEGVTKADWNKETKMMEVSFDDTKTDLDKIETAIANSGYDTKMHKATDEAYYNLDGCCQYDREK